MKKITFVLFFMLLLFSTFSYNVNAQLVIDYHFDECYWDNNTSTYEIKNYVSEGDGDNATAIGDANTATGKICNGGDINSTNNNDKAILLKTNYDLPNKYTLNTWIKFPLNMDGHKDFRYRNKKVNYFNIADRVGSSKDYIYFAKTTTSSWFNSSSTWTLNIKDDDNKDSINFNPQDQDLKGWHMLTFVVSNDGTDFYLDGGSNSTFSTHPNTGKLGLLFNSDYKSSSANTPNDQSIGSDVDEFEIYNKTLSSSDIQTIYDNEKSGKNYNGTERICPNCPFPAPALNYRMDECEWNGTPGEVKDSSPNNHNGTAENGATTEDSTTAGGGICRVGDLDGKYISLVKPYKLPNSYISTFWVKFPLKGSENQVEIDEGWFIWHHYYKVYVTGSVNGTGDIGLFLKDSKNDYQFAVYNNNGETEYVDIPGLDNHWHFFAMKVENGKTKLYIDGNQDEYEVDTATSGDLTIVGSSTDSTSDETIGNYMDEFKIFDGTLNQNQIENIYNNESIGKNYNGTTRICPSCNAVDHYEIIHDSSALTCQPEDITVKACADDNCTTLYTDNATLTMSPSGWVGGDTQTISDGEKVLQLSHTTPEPVTLGISDSNPQADYCCRNSDIDDNCKKDDDHCNITFYDSGFVFDVPNQTSCIPSDNITIEAVRKDDTSQKCVPAFSDTSKTVAFWFRYQTPSSGTIALQIKGNSDSDYQNISSNNLSPTSRTLNFNSNGEATFRVKYNDAGRLNLYAEYDNSSGLVMKGEDVYGGNGNGFVVKPGGFLISALNNPEADNDSDSVFKKAGENFNLEVNAICLTNSSDNGTITKNFKDNVSITHSLFLPSGGNEGVLARDNGTVFNNIEESEFTNGVAQNSINFSEVGIINITDRDDDYLGAGSITGTSANIGRFIPDHFKITQKTDGTIEDQCNDGGFNYTGEPTTYLTSPSFVITAQNKDNQTTQNYKDDLFKLDVSDISITSPTQDDKQLGVDGTNKVKIDIERDNATLKDNKNGTGTYTFGNDNITYKKEANSQISPFSPEFTFDIDNITDSDNVSIIKSDNISVTGSQMKYGRLKIFNNYGPGDEQLILNTQAQYWYNNFWKLNSNDSCISLTISDFSLSDFTKKIDNNNTKIDNTTGMENGIGHITLSAPGENNYGTVKIDLNNSAAFYDWLYDNNTFGIATFGIYRGRDRIIEWKEIPAN